MGRFRFPASRIALCKGSGDALELPQKATTICFFLAFLFSMAALMALSS